MLELSIIVAYHNEGVEFISTSLISILRSIDVLDYEIIVVDDGSDIELYLPKFPEVKILRSDENKGVGSAFDLGVSVAGSENIIFMGSDIRFLKNGWASKMINEIKKYPKAFTCTSCVRLTDANDNIKEKIALSEVENGATLNIMPSLNKSIFSTQWLSRLDDRNIDSYEIPCILGACYGVSKVWYDYVDGFFGHMYWGSLEALISLKSWLFGGSCRIASQIYTAHIFKAKSNHCTPRFILIYNKMFIITTLFNDYKRIVNMFQGNTKVYLAKALIKKNDDFIMEKRKKYLNKKLMNESDFFAMFKIE